MNWHWKQKIEAQITFLRDHVCSGPMHENPEVTEVSANTMQVLLDAAVAAEFAESSYGLPEHIARIDDLTDALDKLREVGDD